MKIFDCIAVTLILSFSTCTAFAKRKVVPRAPLPAAIGLAKVAFLTNGGGSPLAFDEFYLEMQKWGRFQIAASPDKADVVIEVRYVVEDKGTHVWSSTNTYTIRPRYTARR